MTETKIFKIPCISKIKLLQIQQLILLFYRAKFIQFIAFWQLVDIAEYALVSMSLELLKKQKQDCSSMTLLCWWNLK